MFFFSARLSGVIVSVNTEIDEGKQIELSSDEAAQR